MYFGQVIGTCVASQKDQSLSATKLLMIQPFDRERKPRGRIEVAVDTAKAGVGDFVLLVSAREAAQALSEPFAPVDAAIVGIIDVLDDELPGIAERSRGQS